MAWEVLESEAEYETSWYTGGYDLVEQPDGSTKRYFWAELPPAAVVVAAHEGDVIFVRQYRPTIRETCLELPAGIVEDGETFAEAGVRELEEETGFVADDAVLLEEFWCATGVLRHRRGIVAATGLSPDGTRRLDGSEFVEVERVPVADALDRARAGPANDATLEGLLLAREAGVLPA